MERCSKSKSTFKGSIEVAEHLIQDSYTSHDHLTPFGESAAELLLSAVNYHIGKSEQAHYVYMQSHSPSIIRQNKNNLIYWSPQTSSINRCSPGDRQIGLRNYGTKRQMTISSCYERIWKDTAELPEDLNVTEKRL